MRPLLRMLALAVALLGMAEAATAITTGATRLRREPSADARVLGIVPQGTLLIVACQGQWCRTRHGGQAGYVARTLLRPVTSTPPLTGPGAVFYPSCAAARTAGAAPLRLGQPGYRTGLDRNGNSVACEEGE